MKKQDATHSDLLTRLWMALVVAMGLGLIGCAGRPSIFPNSDSSLRKDSTQFAADAASRHPFKADAPSGGDIIGRAEVSYTLKHISVVNLADEPWTDVELWANGKYVVFLKNFPKGVLKTVNFQMMFDGQGNYFDGHHIDQLQILRDGKMYNVPIARPE